MKYDIQKELKKHIESIKEKSRIISKELYEQGKDITLNSTLSSSSSSFFIEFTYLGDRECFNEIVAEWLDYVHFYMDDYYLDDAHTILDINEWTSHIDIKIGFYFR